jgi:hypothetical protein
MLTPNPARNDLAPSLTLIDLPLDVLRAPARRRSRERSPASAFARRF